eukprot:CAMPEP_0173425854 /NCGR_PEP_ID=MMETSP1357-20121228/5468_1 /TAXON_ID=77926 /ORGANISM="Hemiselmis rufescens, Strain PCC563" /LENGTH=31 /DNA_ID= /DNA_START= /DNA_END= /DNA_ORIENTATION=
MWEATSHPDGAEIAAESEGMENLDSITITAN